ncbi:phosphoribosylformylglycinamidine synthase [Ructibacterium gallinarum]|uniref:Phosphoribosylformylglycinamidine synthase n=1 Tax=Ructibacterium gallinarum TaxID=2779355 RepID=A0A9D5M0M2_9FIRM|nr:phosphoribosylformylglycinamidine synthase [Ructibacterium gallinarum]MBE5039278.1 phosphoribosylformylglycinamidine synthase [Ructibacterium gallinarum]
MSIKRLFVEKKKGFDIEARAMYHDLKDNLGLSALTGVRMINRYDVEGISDAELELVKPTVFAEPQVDQLVMENLEIPEGKYFAMEYLPGQFDQRADSAAQCVQIMTGGEKPRVRTAKIVVLLGEIDDADLKAAEHYCVNPVESRLASMEKPDTLEEKLEVPADVKILNGFIDLGEDGLKQMMADMGLAMDLDDIKFCQKYFKETEGRNPSITEIRMIDTYWSDHCRHTTFSTILDRVTIQDPLVSNVYEAYLKSRKYVYGDRKKNICLMDIATIAGKELKKRGLLKALDESEEINACSIEVDVEMTDGTHEKWLVMFKNETHNHPTEIEPFGGAATCLGGAIRDPLSGRSYVYQAMRVTGSGDPRTTLKDTMKGKLPQRKITVGAAQGYSSYGNQIGLATGQVTEIYDEGYVAKRMEIGAVIAAAPKENVIREVPEPGDVVILLGGMTGRDGCGGATGSSKAHNDSSLETCGAEVQKGNAPVERKLQRLFRKKEVAHMIRRCNDFGAGGVSVAIGELADGLSIDLDKVPKKYEGLDGTELAISESQERMAVVVRAADADRFIQEADAENLEAVVVAKVNDSNRLVMQWRGKTICDISRDFLNTNGAEKHHDVTVPAGNYDADLFRFVPSGESWREKLMSLMSDLNVASQKGLAERFDSTIGAGSVFMPFGGKTQMTPQQNMVALLPVLHKETNTGTVMAFGYNPKISKANPFLGAVCAVVDSVTRAVCAGADYKDIYLTFQEYFERLGTDPMRWGKPLSALLGGYYVQEKLGIAAIGGKDSMSGSFNDIDVPPTLTSFAVAPLNAKHAVSSEFKGSNNLVFWIKPKYGENGIPDFESLKALYDMLYMMISDTKTQLVQSVWAVGYGGVMEAVLKMGFGNQIGFAFTDCCDKSDLFTAAYGSVVVEVKGLGATGFMGNLVDVVKLGHTTEEPEVTIEGEKIALSEIMAVWQKPLEEVFATKAPYEDVGMKTFAYGERCHIQPKTSFAKPRIFIPAFPGTNCEYDSARAFERAGGIADVQIFKNLKPEHIEDSISRFVQSIQNAQIIMLPGGFSGGDEPDGSGKFIKAAFENERVKEAVMELLYQRDGLMLGICNGFQALIKLGLVPYGEIRKVDDTCPTLTFNTIGRHVSQMVSTRIASVKSPWFSGVSLGEIHQIAVSHGEGRFVASPEVIAEMEKNGQVATQYVDPNGNPTYEMPYNPNGSYYAIEGITSKDGRILGKMGHSERFKVGVFQNIPGNKDQKIFASGVNYFK